jgi:hypothetical protein
MSFDRAWIVFVAAVVTLGVWALAGVARADPVIVTWTNTANASFPPATKALLCVGEFCSMASTLCAPGATCETEHNLPPGEYTDAYLMASSPEFGFAWSVPVPGTLAVEAQNPTGGVCQHDSNGDGVVSTVDFGSFFREFRSGCGD